jgi:hypothetical protein
MAIRTPRRRKPEIDLNGPQGNAFYLLGTARDLAKKLQYSERMTEDIINDMKSSDYEHLIKTFDNHFGRYIDLVR